VPRLAWFTPLPPVTSGVAQYNVELLPGLTSAHQIDLFVDGHPDQFVRPDTDVQVFSAHDFVWKRLQQPYDLVVYQFGNAPCHDYMWAYFARYPGLVVLHDGQLHHSRGRLLMRQKRDDDYRAEFRFGDSDADPDLAELGIAGLLGSLTYLWSMRRVVVESSRLVVVHNQWLADQIQEESPGARVAMVDMGVPAPDAPRDARPRVLARHGIPADAMLFTAFGNVTPEKRIPRAIQALAALAPSVPSVHLLLVGGIVDHYDAQAEAVSLGIADRVTITGFVPNEDVADYLAASDACLCMRWPSSRETSAAWLRCLAAGRPTIVTDLVHTVDVPALDPRDWSVLHAPTVAADEAAWSSTPEPACISIDILNENHSLRLAMRRLATDPRLRAALARGARNVWSERFTLERMVSGYLGAIERARTAPGPDAEALARLPPHFLTDGTERMMRLLREIGLPESRIAGIWT
jgi:glycosyltransferase involved in cell wall biosynthesis